jgi:hypothetical protein
MNLEHEAGTARPSTIRFVGSEIFTLPCISLLALTLLQSAEWKILLPFFGFFLHVVKLCILFTHDDDLLICVILECAQEHALLWKNQNASRSY